MKTFYRNNKKNKYQTLPPKTEQKKENKTRLRHKFHLTCTQIDSKSRRNLKSNKKYFKQLKMYKRQKIETIRKKSMKTIYQQMTLLTGIVS